MDTTKMLTISSTELIMIEALLENFNSTNPHDVLLKMSNSILSNIADKKKDYKNEFDNENFIEVDKNLRALIKGDMTIIKKRDESICKTCHFMADEKCTKINEIHNYWGEDDGNKMIENLLKNNINACVFFELRKFFEILNIKNENGNCFINFKITQGDDLQIVTHKKKIVDFLIFKYGEDCFINLKEHEEQLKFLGV